MEKRTYKLILLVSILATLIFRVPSFAINGIQTGEIGDFVWNDLNRNGIQDNSEVGIPVVTVQLHYQNNVATTTTDGNGLYRFTNLPDDTYQIFVDLPAGYAFTVPYIGGNPALDSNVNSSGWSELIPISGEQNLTIDAGLYQAQAVPEPTTMILVGSGLVGLWGARKKFKK